MNSNIPLQRIFVTIVLMLSFFGCGRKTEHVQSSKPLQLSKAVIQHIKLQDIPVPVGFVPSENHGTNPEHIALSYKGDLSVAQSIQFCKKSMELHGWEIKDFSLDTEGLLFCKKSKKNCAVSIRRNTHKHASHKTDIHVILHEAKRQHHKNIESINKKEILLS